MTTSLPRGPSQPILTAVVWLLLAGCGLLPGLSHAAGAESEVRQFTILVDGKQAGAYHMTITRQQDGTVSLAAQSDVRVTVLAVPVYTYSYRGLEVWHGGRLQRFESSGKENSRTFAVQAVAERDGLRVTVNGTSQTVRPDVWTSSCWKLPDPPLRSGPVPLLGCDNGQTSVGQLQLIGNEQIKVAGQPQVCAHYRVLKKNVPHELWYDQQERLVREEWVSDGHRTILELAHIQR